MAPDSATSEVLEQLRREAVTDPKQARASVQAILNGPEAELVSLLQEVSGPGDGRVRQVVAMVFRLDSGAGVLEPWLRRWLESEPDEFTKNAVEAALASRTMATLPRSAPRVAGSQVIEAYRYVADRLCHRVRNALALPNSQLVRLQ